MHHLTKRAPSMAYLSSRSQPATADCDNSAILLPRLGSAMMIDDGAARSGRRTARPHACPAAPSDFARGDRWRGATVDFLTNQSRVDRSRSKYGIPLKWASVLIDPGSVLSLIGTELSYRRWQARLGQAAASDCEPDPEMVAIGKSSLIELRARLRYHVGYWRDNLRSGQWLASALIRNVWISIDPTEWFYDRDTSLSDWLEGRVCLGGTNYLGICVRPSHPLELDKAVVAFGYRALVLEYLRALQDDSSTHWENFRSQLQRHALSDVAAGYLDLCQIDKNTGNARPIAGPVLEGARIGAGNIIHLANGETLHGVHAAFPYPFRPTGFTPRSPAQRLAEPSTPASIALPADDRKLEAKPKLRRVPKDAIAQPEEWPWQEIVAEIIHLSLLGNFRKKKSEVVGKTIQYLENKYLRQPGENLIYNLLTHVPKLSPVFGQYEACLSADVPPCDLDTKHQRPIWGQLISLARQENANSLSHDDVIGHLTGFFISKFKARPNDIQLREEKRLVWPEARNPPENTGNGRKRNRSTAA